jgi:hypothetical protein
MQNGFVYLFMALCWRVTMLQYELCLMCGIDCADPEV